MDKKLNQQKFKELVKKLMLQELKSNSIKENFDDDYNLGIYGGEFDQTEFEGPAMKAAKKDIGKEFVPLGKSKFEKNMDTDEFKADLKRQNLNLPKDKAELGNIEKMINTKKAHEKQFGAGSLNETDDPEFVGIPELQRILNHPEVVKMYFGYGNKQRQVFKIEDSGILLDGQLGWITSIMDGRNFVPFNYLMDEWGEIWYFAVALKGNTNLEVLNFKFTPEEKQKFPHEETPDNLARQDFEDIASPDEREMYEMKKTYGQGGKAQRVKYNKHLRPDGKKFANAATRKDGKNIIKKHSDDTLNETGEWSDDEEGTAWIESLRGELEIVQNMLTPGLHMEIIDIKGFDKYQGPYAHIQINEDLYEVWTMENNELWIEDFPIDNTSKDGNKPGFIGNTREIAGAINQQYSILSHMNEWTDEEEGPQPGDAEYHNEKPVYQKGLGEFKNIDWQVLHEIFMANTEFYGTGKVEGNPKYMEAGVNDLIDDGFLSREELNLLENRDLIQIIGHYPIIGYEKYADYNTFLSDAELAWKKGFDTSGLNQNDSEAPYMRGGESHDLIGEVKYAQEFKVGDTVSYEGSMYDKWKVTHVIGPNKIGYITIVIAAIQSDGSLGITTKVDASKLNKISDEDDDLEDEGTLRDAFDTTNLYKFLQDALYAFKEGDASHMNEAEFAKFLQKELLKYFTITKKLTEGNENLDSKINRPKDANGNPITLKARVEDLETGSVGHIIRFGVDEIGKMTAHVSWMQNFGKQVPKSIVNLDTIVVKDASKIVKEEEIEESSIRSHANGRGQNLKPGNYPQTLKRVGLKEGILDKIKSTIKGISPEQSQYNKTHGLPADWKGSREGYHEFITNKQHSKGTNENLDQAVSIDNEVFLVVDSPFNKTHYSDLVGQTFEDAPGYAQVKLINPLDIEKEKSVKYGDEEKTDLQEVTHDELANEWPGKKVKILIGPFANYPKHYGVVKKADEYEYKTTRDEDGVLVSKFGNSNPYNPVRKTGQNDYDVDVDIFDETGKKVSSDTYAFDYLYPIIEEPVALAQEDFDYAAAEREHAGKEELSSIAAEANKYVSENLIQFLEPNSFSMTGTDPEAGRFEYSYTLKIPKQADETLKDIEKFIKEEEGEFYGGPGQTYKKVSTYTELEKMTNNWSIQVTCSQGYDV